MTTKKSPAIRYLEKLAGEALTLNNLLQAIRRGEELSQIEYAKMLGISPSHLCDIEKNRKTISPARAVKFAKILGYSETQFVRLSLQGILDEAGLKMRVEVA
jgi:transcriptional regulator with XRE-family HTH domain